MLIGYTFGIPPGVFNINSNTLDNRINPFEIATKTGNTSEDSLITEIDF